MPSGSFTHFAHKHNHVKMAKFLFRKTFGFGFGCRRCRRQNSGFGWCGAIRNGRENAKIMSRTFTKIEAHKNVSAM